MRIPLMLIGKERGRFITSRLRGIAGGLGRLLPGLRLSLVEIEADIDTDEYVALSVVSAVAYGFLMSLLIFVLLVVLGAVAESAAALSVAAGLVIFILFTLLFMLYPSILAGKKAEKIEKDLIFGLKDMLLEMSSGATVYKAMVKVSKAGYGEVSREFEKAVRKVGTGTPVDDALEELALRTTSEPFRNSLWQIINALKVGSNIENTLRELVKDLTQEQRTRIRNYAQELNMMVLLYMLFAVVVPTIITTVLIVVAPFMGLGLGPEIFFVILPVSFFIQIALVEFVKSRRPVVHL